MPKLDKINEYFTIVFFIEVVLMFLALGFKEYLMDSFSLFDFSVVTFSLVDMILSNLNSAVIGKQITVLRAFRILRIFKLAKTWTELHELLGTLWKTIIDISSFTVVLFLFMFIYTILGMELFAFKAKFTNDQLDLENG